MSHTDLSLRFSSDPCQELALTLITLSPGPGHALNPDLAHCLSPETGHGQIRLGPRVSRDLGLRQRALLLGTR